MYGCVKRFTDRRALEYLQSPLSEKKREKFFPTEMLAARFWPFWWPVVGGDTFSPLAPNVGLKEKVTTSPVGGGRGGGVRVSYLVTKKKMAR